MGSESGTCGESRNTTDSHTRRLVIIGSVYNVVATGMFLSKMGWIAILLKGVWYLMIRGPPGHDTLLSQMTGLCSGCKSLLLTSCKPLGGGKKQQQTSK